MAAGLLNHRRLLNLIENLPPGSAFVDAMANDQETAERISRGEISVAEPENTGPRMLDWTPEMSLLAELVDRVGTLITATLSAAGAKQLPRIPPAPRPETAVDAAVRERRAQEKRQKVLEIIEAFNPGGEPPPDAP